MREEFFLVSGFALLWLKELPAKKPAAIFSRGLELAVHIAVLLLAVWVWERCLAPEVFSPLFLIFVFAYLGSRIRKMPALFFLTVTSLTAFLIPQIPGIYSGICKAAALAMGIALFEFLMTGLLERLKLSPVPKPLAGLPLYFLTASLLALALTGAAFTLP